MTIRRKLLLFIPLLVLLVNSVTFFLFQSGKVVQQSYSLMMDRILLYNQSSQTAEDSLRTLYGYLLNPAEADSSNLKQIQEKLLGLRTVLFENTSSSPQASALTNYVHILDTFIEQEQAAVATAITSGAALAHYEDAEKTFGFIREDGQLLVDLELSSYQPVYKQIQEENKRLNRLGAAVFIINTLMSILLAVWISRSITGPVSRLVEMARTISKGKLEQQTPPLRSADELGLLSTAFGQMSADLKALIEKDKESLEKDRLVKELELQALQSQINPHFLFNTLNVLSKLALLEGAEKTSDLIVSMSNLLRYNLGKLDRPVTLRDELENIKEYFTIQQARFRDRIRFDMNIEESALQELIPSLTLQPLVENAFVHGLEGMESGAILRLDIRYVEAGVRIVVSDNGRGMSEETRQALLRLEASTTNKQSTGLGTRNVFKRLKLFYGHNHLVDIDSKLGEGTKITITIPQVKERDHLHVSAADRG
ncbi:HAMP domain-containing protein [Paenibacillus sp. LMG 31456]|uniref:histidine kinase n=1 Tax=Paenibacillus foliorum TaxID=2654974 RepID=A0A972K1N0_9BACL|nr:sensor histidine kinase [Paenibacillus foliorum]NOU96864.1 HAMP domain-containing protein [Paenibacillus foliorum]